MTPKGYQKLRDELQRLKGMRPEIANAIEIARGNGDLSENADYDAAKEQSGMVEAKIRDIEAKLSHAEVIGPEKLQNTSRVTFGHTVTIVDIDSGEEKKVTIVGTDESNVAQGLISNESPLARGLIGKEEGEVVKLALPGGAKDFEIVRIFVSE